MKISVENLTLNVKGLPATIDRELHPRIAAYCGVRASDILSYRIVKRSIDARRKPDLKLIYSLVADIRDGADASFPLVPAPEEIDNGTPRFECRNGLLHPIVIGSGPAGLFCALILAQAGCRPIVLERGRDVDRRHEDIDDFVEKFVRNYDYWLSDNVTLDTKNLSPVENMNHIIQTLIDSLAANPVMQKLIAWELNENTYVTRRTAQNRDNNSQEVIHYFENQLKANDINFNVGCAILIGGVYYLIMHKDLATFNNIDFSTDEGMQMLKETVSKMIYKLFGTTRGRAASTTEKLTSQRIARNLLQSGVDRDTILKATGLSEEEMNEQEASTTSDGEF